MINFKASACGRWCTTKETWINDYTYIFKAPMMSKHWPLKLWDSSSYLKKTFPPLSPTMPTLTARSHCNILLRKIENFLFTPCLEELFSEWNNTVQPMRFWVHTAGRYRATSILGRVHAAFFNCHQFDAMTHVPDEIVLARMMTALDFEFNKAIDYHDGVYQNDKYYRQLPQVMRSVHIHSVFTTEASFNLADYKETQQTISPSCPDGIKTCCSVRESAGA